MNAAAQQTTKNTDQIEKSVLIRAPRSRVWRALTDTAEFGAWFGVHLEGTFQPGRPIRGRMTRYMDFELELVVDSIEPETRFAYRWHPYAVDPNVDYSKEPMTLVEFHLEDSTGGTLLRVIESGFTAIPASRYAEALRMNTSGWGAQLENIRQHVSG